jgi:hypothetical protein
MQGKGLMRCHQTLRLKVKDWLDENKGSIYKRVVTKEADLPALRAMAEDPMSYHQ